MKRTSKMSGLAGLAGIWRPVVCAIACGIAAHAGAQGLSVQDDTNAPQNNPRLMPNAARGSEYPTHGNQQAGEMNLNPTDPRAQLVNGLPNNTNAGGYGSPLAGVRTYVQPSGPATPSN
ncbi:hypothetical protein [Paraburkholderia sp. BCC1886]|uniref:hypothetical protein n=1 Tax=Paraburkholderia sp. BCC1886 TaxID=2562670 RepID=UPI0011836523|nr:hypothetical protein [Paraburkholderia sp. BCC1886]